MRTFLSAVVVMLLAAVNGLQAAGTTRVVLADPTYQWNGNTGTVTIVVTMELSSDEHSFVGETREAIHTIPALPDPPITPVFSNGFGAGGPPTPGGGAKTITYTFEVQNGWTYDFEAVMKYKKTANDPPSDFPKKGSFTATKP